MELEGIWAQVGNWGFPMIVAIYRLVRVERKLDELTSVSVIHRLGQALRYERPLQSGANQ